MNQSNFALAMLILALLVGSTRFAAGAAEPRPPDELKKILDAPPLDPKEDSKAALTKIYMECGRAAITLRDLDWELKELDAGIQTPSARCQARPRSSACEASRAVTQQFARRSYRYA